MHFIALAQPVIDNLFDADGTVYRVKEDSSFYYFAGDIKSAGKVRAYYNFYDLTNNGYRNINALRNDDSRISITGLNGETISYSQFANFGSNLISIEGNKIDTVFSTLETVNCLIKGDTSYFLLLVDTYSSFSILELSKKFDTIKRWDFSTDGYQTDLTYLDSMLIITGTFKKINNQTLLGAAYFNRNTGQLNPVSNDLILNMPSYIPEFYKPAVSDDYIYFTTKGLNYQGDANVGLLFRVSRNTLQVDANWKQASGLIFIEAICGSDYLYIQGSDSQTDQLKMFRLAYSDASKDPGFQFNFGSNALYSRIDTHVQIGDFIYLGGYFTSVNNKKFSNLLRFNEITGELDMTWTPNPNDQVYGLSVNNDEIFISGLYTTIGAQQVKNLFRASKNTLKIDTAWMPSFNGVVNDFMIKDNYLIAGGIFDTINGVAKSNLVKIDLDSAQVDVSWNSQVKGIVSKLEIKDDKLLIAYGKKLFGECYYDTIAITQINSGAVEKKWSVKDIYDITDIDIDGDYAYVVGKITNNNPDTYFGFASINLVTQTLEAPWNFRAQDNILTVNHDEEYVYIGGEFTQIDAYERQGIARINKSSHELDTAYVIKVMNNVSSIEFGSGNMYLGSNHGVCDCMYNYSGKYARLTNMVNVDYLSKEYIYPDSRVYSILHKDSITILTGSFPYMDKRKSIMFLREPNDIQAKDLKITSEPDSSVHFNWTRGDGEACAMFISEFKDEFPLPDEWIDYKADSNYLTSGPLSTIDSWRCVYKGIGNQVGVSNLPANKKYRAVILEYSKTGDTYVYNGLLGTNYIDFNVTSHVDFTITNIQISNPEALKGADVIVYFNIQNIGDGLSAYSCKVGAYLSTDTLFDPEDLLIDTLNANELQSGEIDSLSFLFNTKTFSSGNYNILVVADYNNLVNEFNESNNIKSTPLRIYDEPYNIINPSFINNLIIYPNPAHDFLIIKPEKEMKLQYNLFNTTGILLKMGEINSESNIIRLDEIPNGSYVIQLINIDAQKMLMYKVIILH